MKFIVPLSNNCLHFSDQVLFHSKDASMKQPNIAAREKCSESQFLITKLCIIDLLN